MNEYDWVAATDPQRMIRFVATPRTTRKLRLFACACCRAMGDLLTPIGRATVEVAEAFAEGRASVAELAAAGDTAHAALPNPWPELEDANGDHIFGTASTEYVLAYAAIAALAITDTNAYHAARDVIAHAGSVEEVGGQLVPEGRLVDLLHDIFGNPFQPVNLDPQWLTPTVSLLARGIDAEKAFDRLPILADALEEAGCDHPHVLAHCREHRDHVRGCWVLDLVLGE